MHELETGYPSWNSKNYFKWFILLCSVGCVWEARREPLHPSCAGTTWSFVQRGLGCPGAARWTGQGPGSPPLQQGQGWPWAGTPGKGWGRSTLPTCFLSGLPGDTPANHVVPSAASESSTHHLLFLINTEVRGHVSGTWESQTSGAHKRILAQVAWFDRYWLSCNRATCPQWETLNNVLFQEQGRPCRTEWPPLVVLKPQLLCPVTQQPRVPHSQLCLPNSGRLRSPPAFPSALQPRHHPGRELR